jgi:hypothetical protein
MIVYFVYMYENRTMKTVEIVLRRGGIWETDGGVNIIKIYCKHIRKCHSESPLYN